LLDFAAPGASFATATLDELLEALEVRLDATLDRSERVSDLFCRTF
jgi:hypothetical protein